MDEYEKETIKLEFERKLNKFNDEKLKERQIWLEEKKVLTLRQDNLEKEIENLKSERARHLQELERERESNRRLREELERARSCPNQLSGGVHNRGVKRSSNNAASSSSGQSRRPRLEDSTSFATSCFDSTASLEPDSTTDDSRSMDCMDSQPQSNMGTVGEALELKNACAEIRERARGTWTPTKVFKLIGQTIHDIKERLLRAICSADTVHHLDKRRCRSHDAIFSAWPAIIDQNFPEYTAEQRMELVKYLANATKTTITFGSIVDNLVDTHERLCNCKK